MEFRFSKHAEEQILRRNIKRQDVIAGLLQPEQKVMDADNPEITVFQSLMEENGQMFLLRIFVNTNVYPNVIVTLYRTTKISKYYESKI